MAIVREIFYVYLAVFEDLLSAVLLKEDIGIQHPIYFVSKMLRGVEKHYLNVKKLVLALVHESRRLRHYFQTHPIHVLANQLLRQILMRLKAFERSKRLVK